MSKRKEDGKKRHHLMRLVLLGAVGAAGYAWWKTQTAPSSPERDTAGGRVVLKDEENLSGVGLVMENMIGKYADDPAKVRRWTGSTWSSPSFRSRSPNRPSP